MCINCIVDSEIYKPARPLSDSGGPSLCMGDRGQGNKSIYFREQESTGINMKDKGKRREFLGTGNIGNQDFYLGEREQIDLFQWNKGTGTHLPLGLPHSESGKFYCIVVMNFVCHRGFQ